MQLIQLLFSVENELAGLLQERNLEYVTAEAVIISEKVKNPKNLEVFEDDTSTLEKFSYPFEKLSGSSFHLVFSCSIF